MTETTLSFLSAQLNNFIFLKDPLNSAGALISPVVLDSIVNQKNEPLHTGGDFVFMNLVNIEEETVGKSQLPYLRTADDKLNVQNPDIKLNLYVQFSAFSDSTTGGQNPYTRALKLLDQVILFFQFRNVFHASHYPVLAENGMEKIIVEPISLTFEQLNHLWATLGAKYLPSVLYKIRTLTFRETGITPQQPLIREVVAHDTAI